MSNDEKIHEDVGILKYELKFVRNDINELKIDRKEDRKMFMDMIDSIKNSNQTLTLSIERITALTEEIVKRNDKQDERMDRIEENTQKKIDDMAKNNKWAWRTVLIILGLSFSLVTALITVFK